MPYRLYLCLAHSILSPPMSMQHIHQPWSTNDIIYFISSHDFVGSSILTWLAFHYCLRLSVPSLAQASPPHGPWLQSLQLALHACNRSIKPSLVLIFSTLVTWLNIMSHMQWAPSSYLYLWTNFLCISHKRILVHLGCHSITKTNQGSFIRNVGHRLSNSN